MTLLNRKALEGLVQLMVALMLLIFLPAWTLNYWQAWVFLSVFFVAVLAVTLYLMRHDPALLERRVRAGPGAEKETRQKIIQSIASMVFISVFVFSALDFRFHRSTVSFQLSLVGDVLVALGLYIVFLVFKENSFTSATIETTPEQKVVTTGPYAVVRHPMYSGAFVMLVGVPLALGSVWGLLTIAPLMLIIIWRLCDEERFLAKNLDGYVDYKNKTRYRLIPFFW